MMNTIKKKVKIWKALLAIPTVCLVIFVVSCNEEVVKDLNTFEEVALQSSMPSELNGKLAELQRQYPKADFTYIETEGITKEDFKRLSSSIDPGSIAYIKTFEEENKTGIIVSKNGPIRSTPDVDGVYMIVEESAMPQGGYESFYNRIATKLLYPTQARKLGVEGKVYVQFVIDESGNVMQLEVVKGIGAGCDKAAMEAIAQAGPWTPPTVDGKSVKQRIILPISFSLTGEPQLPKGAKG